MKQVKQLLNQLSMTVFAVALLSGCVATENFGNMVRSTEVAGLFESATVLPDHTYYYAGPEARPDAIIGLTNSIRFKNTFWHSVADPQQKLADWHTMLGTTSQPGTENYYFGSWIYGPDGEKLGVWYGYVDYSPVKKVDENTYTIYTPTPSNMENARRRRIFTLR